MSEVLTPLIYQLGVGRIGGLIVGYAVKKIVKVVVVLLGLLYMATWEPSHKL